MKSIIAALIGIVFASSAALAQSGAPGSTPSAKPNTVTTVPPPPPPPGGPDKLTTGAERPRPGSLTGEVEPQQASKSYCYTYASADKCVGWLTACMSPQSGSFSCAAGPGGNHQYVCVCVRH